MHQRTSWCSCYEVPQRLGYDICLEITLSSEIFVGLLRARFGLIFFPKYCSLLLPATRWVISLHCAMRTANQKTIGEPEVLSPQQRRGHQGTTVESIASDSYNYFLLH